jgi:hypothetical protein
MHSFELLWLRLIEMDHYPKKKRMLGQDDGPSFKRVIRYYLICSTLHLALPTGKKNALQMLKRTASGEGYNRDSKFPQCLKISASAALRKKRISAWEIDRFEIG